MSATLTVEVKDADAVSRAAQSALELTRTLGGFVVSSSVATGERGKRLDRRFASRSTRCRTRSRASPASAASSRSRSRSTTSRRASTSSRSAQTRSLRAQIALITARLESETLDAETQAVSRRACRTSRRAPSTPPGASARLSAEARMSTIQLTVVTPGAFGAVAPPSRIDRTIDEALNVLAWEGVVALGLAHRARTVRARRVRRLARAPALPPARGGAAARRPSSAPRVAARASRSAPRRRP